MDMYFILFFCMAMRKTRVSYYISIYVFVVASYYYYCAKNSHTINSSEEKKFRRNIGMYSLKNELNKTRNFARIQQNIVLFRFQIYVEHIWIFDKLFIWKENAPYPRFPLQSYNICYQWFAKGTVIFEFLAFVCL